jgi:hypothetical protein
MGAKKPIVDLAGILLGITVGVPFSIVYFVTKNPLAYQFASTSILLNLFNLLPLYPLDGGRFLFDSIFVRNAIAEVTFKVVTAVGLILIALAIRFWILAAFGLLSLLSVRSGLRAGRAAVATRSGFAARFSGDIGQAPDEVFDQFVTEGMQRLPAGSAGQTVPKLRDVWERLNSRPPKAGKTVGLVFLYVGLVLVGWLLALR